MRKLIVVSLVVLVALSLSMPVLATTQLTFLSANYAEVHILTEAAILLLEDNLDVEIRHVRNFSAAVLLHNAMLSGDADAYISYTGTQFTGVLGGEVTEEWKDREKIYDYVNEQFNERWNISWLEPFGFNNTYAVIVTREFAEEHGVEKISDLQGLSDQMTVAMDVMFRDRPGDGYEAMNAAYDLTWRRPVSMEYGLIYRATASGDVDAAIAYSTDGRISAMDLVILEDDRGFFPPYDCSIIIKNEVLEQFPEIPEILAPLLGAIDEETMGYYNKMVDVEQKEYDDVARILVDDLTN